MMPLWQTVSLIGLGISVTLNPLDVIHTSPLVMEMLTLYSRDKVFPPIPNEVHSIAIGRVVCTITAFEEFVPIEKGP